MDRLHEMVGDSEVALFALALLAGVAAGAVARWVVALRLKASAHKN